MAKQSRGNSKPVTFEVSTPQHAEFKEPLAAYLFDSNGKLVHRANVQGGKVDVPLSAADAGRTRLFIAPAQPGVEVQALTPDQFKRMGAYEPIVQTAGKLINRISVPASIIAIWPFCSCLVEGRVVRSSDGRPVCNARVHICEVDPVPIWIWKLRDPDIFRLRDDLLKVLVHPPIPQPGPGPDPGSLDSRLARSALRFANDVGTEVSLNPQPLLPKALGIERMALDSVGVEQLSALRSTSHLVVRNALIDNWKLLIPWFCYWRWWWAWFRCDEIAVVETDAYGRFEATIYYRCGGDHPDLYFWVEYDFGSGFETVYHPPIPCNTYWDYSCGSEVTIRVTDPRVPACGGPADLPGKQVVVLSIGNDIAVRQVGSDGLTTSGQPFGAKLEPRVDFSVTNLAAIGVLYYQWSYTRVTGPDGIGTTVVPPSPAIGDRTVMSRDVSRHYDTGTTYKPLPIGPFSAPIANVFKIPPVDLPADGIKWITLDEHEDLASAHFETTKLLGTPVSAAADDLAAGLYEITLELFDTAGARVDWTAQGIDLLISAVDAPFGSGTVPKIAAPTANNIQELAGSPPKPHTFGFKMLVRVDNNFCSAQIHPVGGTVTPDADCGFHNYSSLSDTAGLSFDARHPNHFATFNFSSGRGTGGAIADTVTSGVVGEAASNFYSQGGFSYSKALTVGVLTAPVPPSTVTCPNAAFWESLGVYAMAIDGYSRLSGYDAYDVAAFALATPCPGHGNH